MGDWDYDLAYNGGSSLKVAGDLASGTPIDLTLYKTNITITPDTKIDVVYNDEVPKDVLMFRSLLPLPVIPLRLFHWRCLLLVVG